LKQLYIAPGAKPTWKKTQSLTVEGIPGIVDEYEMYVPSGDLYKKIYISVSNEKMSTKVPAGFGIRELAKETVKVEKVIEPKVEQKTVYQYVPRKKAGIIATLITFLLCVGIGGYFIYDGYSKYDSMQALCRETMAERNEIVNSYNELFDENEVLKQRSAEVTELYEIFQPENSLLQEINLVIDEYLNAVNLYNSLYKDYETLVGKYNSLVEDYNEMVEEKKAEEQTKNSFETLRYKGSGSKTIKGINAPAGLYYITFIYNGNSSFRGDLFKTPTTPSYESIESGYNYGAFESSQGFQGPIENGYLNVDTSSGSWEIIIEKVQ